MWNFSIRPTEFFQQKYGVDVVRFNAGAAISDFLKESGAKKLILLVRVHIGETIRKRCLLQKAFNTDSGNTLQPAKFEGSEQFERDEESLYPIIAELRVFKTDYELEVLRYAAQCASDAHKDVMKHIQIGLVLRARVFDSSRTIEKFRLYKKKCVLQSIRISARKPLSTQILL